VRTAIVSDLHLGSLAGEDILREPSIRRVLLGEIASADRLVLLGDAVELRERPLAEALESARPFFEELGEALAGRDVLLVPGNHDHRFAEPLLERLTLSGKPELGLEHRHRPEAEAAVLLERWLDDARLEIAYPGAWLRDDVYATHGHYMDCHMTLPKLECVAAAAVARSGRRLPDPASPEHYERLLRPVMGLAFGFAQSGLARGATRPSERAWRALSGRNGGEGKDPGRVRRLAVRGAIGVGLPAAVLAINRLLDADFDADLSPAAITRSGIEAATETVRRLQLDAAHVITGHSHRAGPNEGEEPWPLPSGGQLHNAGNWVFASAFYAPGSRPGPYWPGTVTWLVDEEPPRRVSLLGDHSAEELAAVAGLGHLRLDSLGSGRAGP